MKSFGRITSSLLALVLVLGAFGVLGNSKSASADTGNATKLVIGSTVSGHFDNQYDVPGAARSNYYYFETDGDRAFYSIAFTSEKPDMAEEISVSAEIGGQSIVKMNPSDGVMDCKNLLKPNSVYYITVDRYNGLAFDYTLKVSKYTDDHSDTAIEAKSIVVDEVVKGNIENSADVDVFSFVAGSDDYNFTATASDNVTFYVYQDELLTTQVTSGSGTKSLDLSKLLTAGNKYFIAVKAKVDGFNPESYMFKIVKKGASPDPVVDPETDPEVTVDVPDVGPVNIKPAKKKVTLKWKKVSGASGYQIVRSLKKSKGYKTIKKINSGKTVSYTDKKVKSGKTYYYKIRAFKKVGGSTKYGGWSSVKKVKVK